MTKRKKTIPGLFFLLVILLALLLSGCSTITYYTQSINGQVSLLTQRKAINRLLADTSLDEKRREQLRLTAKARNYASTVLGLPDNGSYRSYVELDKPYVIWSVVAAPAYSLEPKKSCFPIIGCVSYRGYFSPEKAKAYADKQRTLGYEVFIGEVRAYSTLGWFDDPVLSSMLDWGHIYTVEILFHELAHQLLYFKHDTEFNEAFATLIGEAGVQQWLQDTQPDKLATYLLHLERKNAFIDMLTQAANTLRELYAEPLPEHEMAKQKQQIINRVPAMYQTLKEQWNGYSGYDHWFERPINNARLASVATYQDLVPEFTRWLKACGGNLPQFYQVMQQMKPLSPKARQAQLKGKAHCDV